MPWTQLWLLPRKGSWLGAWTQAQRGWRSHCAHKHSGAGGATVQSYLNTHWVFINSFCNTDHSRAEVLVTFISVSDASQQLSHPEMLVATGWPQSELWKSVPNERVIGHQKSSVTLMFPHPIISFFPADCDPYTKLTSQAAAGCPRCQPAPSPGFR